MRFNRSAGACAVSAAVGGTIDIEAGASASGEPTMGTGIRTAIAGLVLAAGVSGAAATSVDANTATQVELEAIAGIGPGLAGRIADERRKSPFRSLDDLKARVRGIGDANLRKMRESGLVVGRSRESGGAETIVGGASDAPRRRQRQRRAEGP